MLKYLSTLITGKNVIIEEIKMRTAEHQKLKYIKQTLKSVGVCGCEIWSMTEKNENMLNMWEIKILMKMYGPQLSTVSRKS